MFRLMTGICSAFVTTVFVANLSAQEVVTNPTTDAVKIGRLSVLMDSKIYIQEDVPVGQVVDVILSDRGCVDYLVAVDRDRYFVVPYGAVALRGDDRVVFIDMAPAQFKKITYFNADEWPDVYAAPYRQNVLRIFGPTALPDAGVQSTLKPRSVPTPVPEVTPRGIIPKGATPPDRIEGDTAPTSREPSAPIRKPTTGGIKPPRGTLPTDRLPGDSAPVSRDNGAPITKPEPGTIDPPAVNPDLNPAPKLPSPPPVPAPKKIP